MRPSTGRDIVKHTANVSALRNAASTSDLKEIVEKTVIALTEHSCFKRAGGTYRGLGARVMISVPDAKRREVFEEIRDLAYAIEESRQSPQYSAIDAFRSGCKPFLPALPVRHVIRRRPAA